MVATLLFLSGRSAWVEFENTGRHHVSHIVDRGSQAYLVELIQILKHNPKIEPLQFMQNLFQQIIK